MLILKIVAPNGKVTTGKLSLRALVNVQAGYRYELMDSLTGLAPDDLRLKRIGRKLVLQSESQATTLELVNFYPAAENLPVTASIALPGVPVAISDQIASLTTEPYSDLLSADLARIAVGQNPGAESVIGFEAFDEPMQFAQANTSAAGTTTTDAAAGAGSNAGTSAAAGAEGAAAGAGAGEAAATAAGALGGTGVAVAVAAGAGLALAGAGAAAAVGGSAIIGAVAAASGVAIDGYLKKAVVFRDANNNKVWDHEAFVDSNNNGVRDTGESFTDTNADGKWTAEDFAITDAQGNFTGLTGTGKIVLTALIDGNGQNLTTDISTGKAFNQVLSAPEGSTVITPLTTLVSNLVDKGQTVAQAEDKIAASLGLDTNISLSTYDPVLAINAAGATTTAKDNALAVQKATIQLASILTVAAETAVSVDKSQTTAASASAVFDALANSVQNTVGQINLGGSTVIQAVFDGIANSIGAEYKANIQSLDDNLVSSLASINTSIEKVAISDGATSALTQIVSNQIVAQQTLVTAMQTAVTGSTTVDNTQFAGANLLTKTDTAIQTVETITQVTSTVTTLGAPLRPNVTVGGGATFDSRLTTADIGAGAHVKVTLDANGLAQTGDKLVLQMNGTTVATYTLLVGDIPVGAGTTTHSFDGLTLGSDGSKTFVAHLERGTTIGPNSQLAVTTVDTVATAPSALDLITADDTGVLTTDNFTSKTTIKVQGTAEAGASVVVTADGTTNAPAVVADSSGTFIATLTGLSAGSHSITAVATDFSGNTSVASTALSVTISTAPAAATIGAQTVAEDSAVSIALPTGGAAFADTDAGDVLTYSATGLPTGLIINATTGAITGTVANAGVGSHNVTVIATDKAGMTASSPFTLTVTNTNDAPTVANAIPDLAASQSAPFQFTLPATTFADVDVGTTLTYSATLSSGAALPAWLNFDAASRTFSGIPTDVVSTTVRVTASDGTATVSDDFVITVNNVNDAPIVVSPIPNLSIAEKTPFAFTLPGNTFYDADADTLTYTATQGNGAALPGWLSFDAATRTFSGTPDNSQIGSLTLKVTATDPSNTSASNQFNLIVTNVNDAPTVANAPVAQSVNEDAAFSFVLPANTFADVDVGAALTLSMKLDGSGTLPGWIAFDAATRTVSGRASNSNVGPHVVSVMANDGQGGTVSADFGLNVQNVNDAPVARNVIGNKTATEDSAFSFTLPSGGASIFNDVDTNDLLSYSASLTNGGTLPGWLSFDSSTQTFAGTPTNDNVGDTFVRVTAKDLANTSATADFKISVANVNDAPLLNVPVADQVAVKAQAFNLVLPATTFIDVDKSDTLTWSATLGDGSALPTWLSFNATTRAFSGTPAVGDVGVLTVKVVATDGSAATANDQFVINVANISPTNVLPTGTVGLTGTPTQGQTLTATNSLADADGLGTITYQWQTKVTGSDWANVAGTTPTTYALAEADVGKQVRVVANYTDVKSTAESVAGTASAVIANLNDSPTGAVTIGGTATQGQTLTASNTVADLDGLGPFTYQWQSSSNGTTWSDRSTGTTLVLAEADVGKQLRVQAKYVDGHGTAEAVTSTATTAVSNVNDAPAGTVSVVGTPTQGQTLSATHTLTDADGLGTISYQWKADGSNIAGATGSSLVLAETQVGKAITVAASYTDGRTTAESVTSSATAAVANLNDAPTGTVGVGGTATQGQVLTASNTLADVDGLGTVSYQWQSSSDGTTWNNLGTGTTTTLAEAQVGKQIRVVGSYTDGHGTVETVNSAPTPSVANINDSPTGTVSVAGTATQNQTLTASNSLVDADGLGAVGYQWQSSADSGITWGNIGTGATFALREAEVGKLVRAVGKYVDGHGTSESASSAATTAVVNVNDVPTGAVAIVGTAAKTQTLTATPGTLADLDGLGAFTYQWKADNVDIVGATASTLVLTAAELAKVITVTAGYTDGHGAAETSTSAATLAVRDNIAPTGAVTVTGTVAQYQTLTASNTLADGDSPAVAAGALPVTYQWQSSTDGTIWSDVSAGTSITLTSETLVGKQLRVQAKYTDGLGTQESPASTGVVVANVNDAPTVSSGATGTVAENAPINTVVYTATATDPDANTTLAYSLTGTDAAAFNIDAVTGAVTLKASANFEAKSSYAINVVATDNGALPNTKAVVVSVTNVNEVPVFTGVATATVAENTAISTSVYTATATDQDAGAVISYTLTGVDAGAFNINASTGVVTLKAISDFETKTSYAIAVTASDGTLTATQPVAVTVSNVNEAPTVTSGATATVAENAATNTVIYTATATDPDAGTTLAYSLGGTDAALFNIDAGTGAVTLKASANFEAKASYAINVIASDGLLTNTKAVAVTVTDVNEAPVFSSGTTATAGENAATSTVVYTAAAVDPDAGTTLNYSLGAGLDAADFNINASTGAVTFKVSPNFEAKASYSIDVFANDGTLSTMKTVSVSVLDRNDAPTSAAVTATPAVKDQPYNFDARAAGNFADVDAGDTLTYSATGLPAGLIINPTSGAITGTATVEALTNSVTVKATDVGGLNTSQTFNLSVVTAPVITGIAANVAQAKSGDALTLTATLSEAVTVAGGTPTLTFEVGGQSMTATYAGGSGTNTLTFNAITSAGDDSTVTVSAFSGGTITGNVSTQALVSPVGKVVSAFVTDNSAPAFSSATTANFAENGTATAYATAATDATTITYSLSGADAALFNIAPSTGAVSFKAAPDFEAKIDAGADNVYNVTVTANDALGQSATHAVAITVTNVNEAPTVSSGAAGTVVENAATNTVISTAMATDPDAGTTLAYSLGGTDAALFNIDAGTGAVTLKASANFEAKASYAINVIASDGALTNTKAVAVTVTDVNETPVFSSGTTATVAENTATSTVVYAAAATDPDAGTTLVYAIAGTDAAAFNINSGTGAVTLKAISDFETKTSYAIDVTASDGTLTATQSVAVTVTNVNEAPILANAIVDKLAATSSLFNFVVPTNTFGDADVGDTLTWSATQVSGAALPAWLTFTPATHAFSGTPAAGDIGTLNVRVTGKDSGNLSVFDDFNIGISNNPAPTVAANTTSTVNATSAFSLSLSSLFTDTETLSYVLTGTLPTGLSLTNGIISGTVSAANVAAPTAVTIVATDSNTQTASTSLKLYVSEMGAIVPVKSSLVGTTLTIDFLVDETKDPDGGGLSSLNATLAFDSVKLDFLSASGFSGALFTPGTPNETTNPGTVDLGVISLTPLTGTLSKVMSASFTVVQAGDFRIDITPTDFDGVDLSSKSTHAWFSTT